MEQTAHFFESCFLKVSVDQFEQNLYTPIINPKDAVQIFLRLHWKSPGSEGNFREI